MTTTDDLFSSVESAEGSSAVVASLSGTMERGDAVSLRIGTRTITYQIKGDEGGLSPTTPAAVMAEVKNVAESSGLFVGAAGLSIDPEDPSRLLIEPLTSNLGRVEFQSIERTNINDQSAVVELTEEPRPALPERVEFFRVAARDIEGPQKRGAGPDPAEARPPRPDAGYRDHVDG